MGFNAARATRDKNAHSNLIVLPRSGEASLAWAASRHDNKLH